MRTKERGSLSHHQLRDARLDIFELPKQFIVYPVLRLHTIFAEYEL